MGRENRNQRGMAFQPSWGWIFVVPISMLIPVVLKVIVPDIGFFYLEVPVLSFINIGLATYSYRKRKDADSGRIGVAVWTVGVLSITSVLIVILLPQETVFELFNHPITNGILGIAFGSVSVLVTYIGWRIRAGEGEQEIAKRLVGYLVLFSIVVSAMTYAANNPIFVSMMLPVYAGMSFPLGALLLFLGFLAPPQDNQNPSLGLTHYILAVASFGTGFIYGALTIPLTRIIYASLGSVRVYPGVFFFMYLFMITVALIPYALLENNHA